MKNTFSILLLLVLFAFSCTPNLPRNKINVVDNLNRKQGLWITVDTLSFIGVLRYKNGMPIGQYHRYCHNGQIDTYGRYKQGKKQGTWYYYQSNGLITAYGKYSKDKKQGKWRTYTSNGLLSTFHVYKQDSIIKRGIIIYNVPW